MPVAYEDMLARLAAPMAPEDAQAWLAELAPVPGEPCREGWRRALLRLGALHRCIDPDAPTGTPGGVAAVLGALESGLELHDVYDLERDLFATLEAASPDRWREAADLAERGRARWGGADAIQADAIQQLVGIGEVEAARALLPRVRWRQCTVQALQALWPHGTAQDHAAWLAHADEVIAGSSLPPVYSIEPLADLVILTRAPARLAALEAAFAALGPADMDPSQDFDDPRISLARARQACGHLDRAWAALREEPPGWLRWHGAATLFQAASDPADRSALWEEAWASLLAWAEPDPPWANYAVRTLLLDPEQGARHALAFLRAALARDIEDLPAPGGLLLALPLPARDEAAALLAGTLPSLSGESLLSMLKELEEAGRGDLISAEVRARLLAEAPVPEEDPSWWEDAAPWLPTERQQEAAGRLLTALDAAERRRDRDDIGRAALVLFGALPPAARQALAPAITARIDRFRLDELPAEIRARISEAEREAWRLRRLQKQVEFRDRLVLKRILLGLGGVEPAEPSGREAWEELLGRPGLAAWGVARRLAELAIRLEGEEVGAGLLDDALAWQERVSGAVGT